MTAHSSGDTGKTLTDLEAEQRRRNVESRDTWQRYARHRERVSELLLDTVKEPATRTRRLCVLGAGNCNDLDLKRLAETFGEIHLVDLDGDALAEAVRRSGLNDEPDRIRLHAGHDLCGVFPALSAIERGNSVATANDIAALAWAATHCPMPEGLHESITGGFDTVASVGLLSQLIEGVLTRIPNPEAALPLLAAIRSRHLRLLLELARPGGSAVLVTEIVSTDSAPEIAATSEDALMPLLRQLLQQGNFFTGLNPAMLVAAFQNDPGLRQLIDSVQTIVPWKWDFVCRTYAVTAFVAHRKS
jgi:hypothetical protein